MCGIYLYYSLDPITGKRKLLRSQEFNSLEHRGPDSSQFKCYNLGTVIGFKRLAIIDPTDNGMQPFESDCGRFVFMMNGEIYNYRELKKKYAINLKTNSDCEIALHLFLRIIQNGEEYYGDKVPTLNHLKTLCELLDGEFAFVIYDIKFEKTYYGVDQLRVRPLFLEIKEKQGNCKESPYYVLCSEQKALPRILDGVYVKPVESGTVGSISYHPGTQSLINKTLRYYDISKIPTLIPNDDVLRNPTLEDYTKLRTLFVENVKRKLNADREYGFLLSGGLDSSLTCGVAARELSPTRIKTFTVGFDKNASDVIAARKVAKHINSIHTEFIFTFEDGLNILRDVIRINESWDQTTTRASVPMLLCLRAIKKKHPEMAVIYSGEVSDELFMGYLEWLYAPDALSAATHRMERLRDVTFFDGLRADRIITSVGCEGRFPFFGVELFDYVLRCPIQWIAPTFNNGQEKLFLRKAFEGENIIPNEILFRIKNAFSDATSIVGKNSWKQYLIDYAENQITDSRFAYRSALYPTNTPQTKEDMLYREIFDEFGYAPNCVPYKWLPRWSEGTDSSATALSVFNEGSVLKDDVKG